VALVAFLVVLLVVVALDFAAVFVPLVMADFDPDAMLPLGLAIAAFDLSAVEPLILAVEDLDSGVAPGVPHFTNLPAASRQRPLLVEAAGHLTNLPEASRHWFAASAALARLAARLNAARKLSDLRMVILHDLRGGVWPPKPPTGVTQKLRRLFPGVALLLAPPFPIAATANNGQAWTPTPRF
jgi:hypothetical protein